MTTPIDTRTDATMATAATHREALQRTVLVANQKGGVGKTSIVTALAGLVARPDRRVLVVDADPQGNATSSDLGVEGDRGRSLLTALQYGDPLQVLRDVRPGLDLVAGGPFLAQVGAITATAGSSGIDVQANLMKALAQACSTDTYTVVLIDSGPGDAPLLDALLATVRYLVVPTRDDDASLSGVELLAQRYLRARKQTALVELLGVVLFDANPRATARNAKVLDDLDDLLEGSGARSFETMIRSDRAAALDLRTAHLTPGELVDASATQNKQRLARLQGGRHRKAEPGDETTREGEPRLWSRDPTALATDYQSLTRELLSRIAAAEQASA